MEILAFVSFAALVLIWATAALWFFTRTGLPLT